MIKKYPWHFIFMIFIIICLANLFQKLKWKTYTDNILWEASTEGLICKFTPPNGPIKAGDILFTINKYIITSPIDVNRIIQDKKLCRYEIERNGLLTNVLVGIEEQTTPFYYYILVFSGLLFILITLRILNAAIKQKDRFTPPNIFFFLSLSFSGFMILSPTGSYSLADFTFLFLNKIAFLFFPALLIHYSLYFPLKSNILRRFKPTYIYIALYSVPLTIFSWNLFSLFRHIIQPDPQLLINNISRWRNISLNYFGIYITFSLIFFSISNVRLILKKHQRRFILSLAGIFSSIIILLLFQFFFSIQDKEASIFFNLGLFTMVLIPISTTHFLSHRRFTDIENILKKTMATSSVFLFIFGIYFFLDITTQQNKILGIFWSLAAILTAGLIYRPIEETVLMYFDKIFYRGGYNFKKRLKQLIQSIQTERNLTSLSINFLNTITNGLQLQSCSLLIHYKKNMFYQMPEKKRVLLSKNFGQDLYRSNNLIFINTKEFERRYPKDYALMKKQDYNQFLPLKNQDKLIGLIAFGLKKNKKFLSVEDWELMWNISPSLSLSVENAFLYSELETQLNEINLLKEFNENIIENINVGVVVLTRLNMIRAWNQFMEYKFGVLQEQVLNKKPFTVFGSEVWKKIQKKKGSVFELNNVSLKIKGKEAVFDIFSSPLHDSAGKSLGTILVFDDVTEKIMIRNQLIQSEKMASLGLLSAGIAHEVNTPLTGISSYCQLLVDNPDMPKKDELILKMQDQVQRANKIVRSLLDFSRQKGEHPMEVDLNKIISESISLLDHKLKKKNITLKKTLSLSNKIYGFSTRLQQLFVNLLINATDAIDDSKGLISISGHEDEKNVFISIHDNGKGIYKKNIDKIFDPFFTTKDRGEGTGLGLSISYNIIKEHYGDISVNSTPDLGTIFTLQLPIKTPLRSIKI